VGVVLLGAVGLAAGLADGSTSGAGAALPALAAVAVGIPVLWWLVSTLRPVARGAADTPPNAADTPAVGADGDATGSGPGGTAAVQSDRRAFLRASAIVGAAAVVVASAGRWLTRRVEATVAAAAAEIPPVADPLPPVPADASISVEGMPPFITPNDTFYRIDTALQVPTINVDTWRLQLIGMVDNPMELDFDQLLDRYEVVEADITMACVSNEVGGDLVGNARWQGVRLADVLADARVRDGADQLVGRAVDGFTTGSPLEVVLDGRASLIAVGMNGEQLPREHGFPARLVVPGLYGYVSATKWLSEIELTTFDAFDAYWIPRGWAERGPIKTQSRIDVPRGLSTVAPGKVAVAGVAWAPTRGIRAVEVKVDDGPWERARLAARVDVDTWRQWVYEWDARPGRHELVARATDGTGEVQTSERSQPRPDGATGRHSIIVTVSEA
jgi:DMSO/TMAO reductase YedYZ molybdopterin-dependent catalytic subunit